MIHVSDTMIRRIDGLDLAQTARELGYTLLEWDDGFLIPEKEVYLKDNKFVHASSSRGVAVDDLRQNYYATHFHAAARVTTKSKNN